MEFVSKCSKVAECAITPMATYLVAAAVHTKLGGEGDSTAEPEEDVEDVEGNRKHGVNDGGVGESGKSEVEQAEHGEDGDEHAVINNAGSAAVVGNHVAYESHDDEGPEELRALVST